MTDLGSQTDGNGSPDDGKAGRLETTDRVAFSEFDPFQHASTGNDATYFTDHRMEGLAKCAGWDLPTLGTLGSMTLVRRMEIDLHRPATAFAETPIAPAARWTPRTLPGSNRRPSSPNCRPDAPSSSWKSETNGSDS